jgi:hypothetical protein
MASPPRTLAQIIALGGRIARRAAAVN